MGVASKVQILVVDDTSVSRVLICDGLAQLGIKNVTIAKDGQAALDSLKAKPVHLVISDYYMPKLDGLQLLKGMREHKPTSRCGFILVTGRADKEIIKTGMQLGMNNYLAKPFSVENMKKCIEAIVGPL